MVRITKVHTGGGDGGETSLVDGSRVGKEHPRVAIYGTIDEANSAIGIVRSEIKHRPGGDGHRLTEADRMLGIIQQELFDVGAECACPPGGVPEQMSIIGEDAGNRLVEEMDYMLQDLDPLSSFVLPTGNPIVAHLHMARTGQHGATCSISFPSCRRWVPSGARAKVRTWATTGVLVADHEQLSRRQA